jgi:hypothetical protein
MGLTVEGLLVGKYIGIKLRSFVGMLLLLGVEDVGNQVDSFVDSRVMGLTVGSSLDGEYVGIQLGLFVGTLLGLEDVGH